MNVVIVGKSAVNKDLTERLRTEGYHPIAIENVNEVLAVDGEVGAFAVSTVNGNFEAGCIVLTEDAKTVPAWGENAESSSFPAVSLLAWDDRRLGQTKQSPIVLLMDYPTESPAFMTEIALKQALTMAGKRKKVIYLTRFVRTAAAGLENLYSKVRIAGVVFVKYDQMVAGYDPETALFTLRITTGSETLRLTTNVLITADQIVGNAHIDLVGGALKLKNVHGGVVANDRFFLFPDATNRKGIQALSCADHELSGEEAAFRIKSIVANIKNDLVHLGNTAYAQVDPAKCALCYTCFRACPHAALTVDPENSAMKTLPQNCYACGLCASLCPAGAISIVTEAKTKPEAPSRGKLRIFCCEHSGAIAVKRLNNQLRDYFDSVAVTSVACGGAIDPKMLLDALKDYTQVLVAVCMDEACRHFNGDHAAFKQVERARRMLEAAGLDQTRITAVRLSAAMPQLAFDSVRSLVGE
jgi:coenzyme F420-reducing hydrogenase delta subunit/NAD-dependent dihydropyrimidine dehydrogenase PreA subunit